MKLINGHHFITTETANTWYFALYNRKRTLLLWHSCSKNCKSAGEAVFMRKVMILYEQLLVIKEAKRSLLLNRRKENLESLLAEIATVETQVASIYTITGNTDFLAKINRVVLPL